MENSIVLRHALETDLKAILEIYNDVLMTSTAIYQNTSRDFQQHREWFKQRSTSGFPVLVAELEGRVVGYGSFGTFRTGECYSSTVEHSLHVASSFRGKGIGSQILLRLMSLAREKGFHAMIGGIDSTNTESLRLHERHGFQRVGTLPQVARKFSKWLDLTFMQARLTEVMPRQTSPNTQSERFFSGAPWEKTVGYCRAVKRGHCIAVSGTTSIEDGKILGVSDPYAQAKQCLKIIEEALNQFNLDRTSIVRTRIFVTSMDDWPEIGKAHHEFFHADPPATSMIQVAGLIDSELLVEIEADAVSIS